MLYEDVGRAFTLWLIAAAVLIPTMLVLLVPDVGRMRAAS